jgi:choline dehydrogenase
MRHPKVEEFNRGDNFGNAYFHMNQKGGVRWSASKAWLREALKRPNLKLVMHAHTRGLAIEEKDGRKRAVGVNLTVKGEGETSARARREVILAAGSIGSPQILQLSGIGPARLLGDAAIPVVHELPGVGGNLHDHLQIRMVWKVKGPTLNERANSLFGKAAMGLEYLFFKTGPLTMPPSQLGAFAKSDARETSPDIEWHVQPLSLEKFGEPLHPFPRSRPSVCNLRPTSRGHVRIKSSDPFAAPEIRLNYLSTPRTRRSRQARCASRAASWRRRALSRMRRRNGARARRPEDDAALVKAGRRPGDDHLPPGGHLPHGPGSARGRGRPPACARHRGAARYRCIGHAANYIR